MELQLTDIATRTSKQMDASSKVSSNRDDSQAAGSFDEQYNQQIEQVKGESSIDKNQQNQQDIDISDDSARPETRQQDRQSEDSSGNEINTAQSEQDAEMAVIDASLIEIEQHIILPLMGTILPLNQAQKIMEAKAAAVVVTNIIDSKFNSDTNNKSIELLMQNQQSLIKSTSDTTLPVQNAVAGPLSSANSQVLKPLNTDMLSTDKVKLQDAIFSKLMNEMPAAEMISQSSRLQQVPIASAVMANLSAAQNVSINAHALSFTADAGAGLSSSLSSSISANVQSAQWSQQMTQQVSLMIKGGLQQAEIKLNPANLGPMEIKLNIKDDQVSVSFITQHAVVKEALDAAMPKLREMFEEQGIDLAESNVSTQAEQEQANESSQNDDELNASTNGVAGEIENSKEENETINISVESGVSVFA